MLYVTTTILDIYFIGLAICWAIWGMSGLLRDSTELSVDCWKDELHMVLVWPLVLLHGVLAIAFICILGPVLLYLDCRGNDATYEARFKKKEE